MGRKPRTGPRYELSVPALAIQQTDSRVLYSFAVDGKELPCFTTVSRVQRDENHAVSGYQRPESLAHIRGIRRYLESADAILPNALVVAFDDRVRFETRGRPDAWTGTQAGRLVIPVDERLADHDKPGWIVDGQQRSAAIRDADVERFPVYITAFITGSIEEQRSQFILVNSTKPLPKGLIHELLPSTPEEHLPIALLKRRLPALLVDHLNYDDPSGPLHRKIRTPTTLEGTIKDNSMLKMIAMSIEDGALYHYFDPDTGEHDIPSMTQHLTNFWAAVATVFPEAWEESPRRSRLVHGVGIVSLGSLMDEISYRCQDEGIPPADRFAEHLAVISDECHWTQGAWPLSRDDHRPWNELQNTPREIKALSDHLIRLYRDRMNDLDRDQVAA